MKNCKIMTKNQKLLYRPVDKIFSKFTLKKLKLQNQLFPIVSCIIGLCYAANERDRLWREKISRDQCSPSIILCTPLNLQRIFFR